MSDTPLPAYVDARKAFSQEASISGYIELNKLERGSACAAGDGGPVRAELNFSVDSAGRRRIRGRVMARMMLECQRCLEPVAVELNEEIDLVLVPDEESARALDKQFDPWVCADHRIMLADLLDEQLLLGIPIVSYHQQGPCAENLKFETGPGADEDSASDRKSSNNPFAVLEKLKLD